MRIGEGGGRGAGYGDGNCDEIGASGFHTLGDWDE